MSLADSCLSLVDRILSDFSQLDVMWAYFPSSGALGWEAQVGVETPAPHGEPLQLRYPSGI